MASDLAQLFSDLDDPAVVLPVPGRAPAAFVERSYDNMVVAVEAFVLVRHQERCMACDATSWRTHSFLMRERTRAGTLRWTRPNTEDDPAALLAKHPDVPREILSGSPAPEPGLRPLRNWCNDCTNAFMADALPRA